MYFTVIYHKRIEKLDICAMDGTRRTKKVVGSRSLLLDGSWFSIKQTPELNLQRAGNYRRVNYVSLKALPIIRPWEIEKSSGLGKKSLVFCLRASERKKRKSISIGRSYLLFGPGGHVGSLQSVLLIRPFLPELWKRKKRQRLTEENLGFALQCEFVGLLFLVFIHKPSGRKGGFVEVAAGVADSIA